MDQVQLDILDPERRIYSGLVDSIHIPTTSGPITVLPHNYPILSIIETGVLYYAQGDNRVEYAISGGVLVVEKERTYIIAETIERFDEIDVNRAEAAKERAQEELAQKQDHDIDVRRATAALMRAMVRLQVVDDEKNPLNNPNDID